MISVYMNHPTELNSTTDEYLQIGVVYESGL